MMVKESVNVTIGELERIFKMASMPGENEMIDPHFYLGRIAEALDKLIAECGGSSDED